MAKFDWKHWIITRLLYGVLPVAVVASGLLFLANANRDSLLLRGSSGMLHHLIGFRNNIGSAEFLPNDGGYLIKDISLRNPNVFRVRPEFATINTLLIELDKPAKQDGKVILNRLVIDINDINIVLWDRGVLNLSYLSGMRQKTNEMLGLETIEDTEPQEDYLFFIRRLEVSVGNVSFTDTTGRRNAPSVSFTDNRKFVFTDLKGVPEVIRAISALIVADRPIPTENLPINNYLNLIRTGQSSPTDDPARPEGEAEESDTDMLVNPNILGQEAATPPEILRPQEEEITDFGTGENSAADPAQEILSQENAPSETSPPTEQSGGQ